METCCTTLTWHLLWVQCYSFGCPYVGNHLFAQHCEASVRDTWHIVNDRDIIPRSGKFLFLFKRPGCACLFWQSAEQIDAACTHVCLQSHDCCM